MLLVTLGVVFMLSPLIGRVCHRLGLPLSVGYILLGLIIGTFVMPSDGTSPVFTGVFEALAQLGVVALLFRVGLRSHTKALLKKLPDASIIWLGNVFGSFAVGYVIARYGLDWSIETSLVIATAFSATSIAVSVSVWDEMGKLDSGRGQLLVDVAELDDLSAAVILAVLLGTLPVLMSGNGNLWVQVGTSTFTVLIKLALFIAGCYLFAHFVEARFTSFNRRLSNSQTSLTISILGAGMAIAAVADSLGFSVAIGALFAGFAFSRDPVAVRTDGRFTYFYDLLTPFFFIYIGMQTDIVALLKVLDTGLILFLCAALAKLVFTTFPAMLSMNRKDSLILGVSMIPRAEIALVVVYECRLLDERIVSSEVFASMVLVSLVTCIVSPVILRHMLNREKPA